MWYRLTPSTAHATGHMLSTHAIKQLIFNVDFLQHHDCQHTMMMIRGMIIIINNISMVHAKKSHKITENQTTIRNKVILKYGITHSMFSSLLIALSCNVLRWCYLCRSWWFSLLIDFFLFHCFLFLCTKKCKALWRACFQVK